MDLYIIIIIVLLLIIAYLLYKNKYEYFDITDDIKQAINDIYKVDMSTLRTLGTLSNNLLTTTDTLTIDENQTNIVNINANLTTLKGNLESKGDVNFVYSDKYMINIFIKNTIILWQNNNRLNIPLGWAPADGKMYIINNNKTTQNPYNYVENIRTGVLTPDLTPLNNKINSKNNNINSQIIFIIFIT